MINYQEDNKKLFDELKRYGKDSPEYKKLVNRIFEFNHNLTYDVANHFYGGHSYEFDDICAVAEIGLFKAISNYDSEKEAFFSYFAHVVITREIQNFLKKESHVLQTTSFDRQIGFSEDNRGDTLETITPSDVNIENDFLENEELEEKRAFLRSQLAGLNKKQCKILKMRYLSGDKVVTHERISKVLGCSRAHVHKYEQEALETLRNILKTTPREDLLSREQKLELRGVLKSLIETKLPENQKEVLLSVYYSPEIESFTELAKEFGRDSNWLYRMRQTGIKQLAKEYNSQNQDKPLNKVAIVSALEFNEDK